MNDERNQQIVTRALGRESFAAIGRSLDPPMTRERVRQIFNMVATPAQRIQLDTPVTDDGEPAPVDLPKEEPRIRQHVPLLAATDLTQKQIRAGVRRWLAGEFDIVTSGKPEACNGRLDLLMAKSMRDGLIGKGSGSISAKIRGVIEALEQETTK